MRTRKHSRPREHHLARARLLTLKQVIDMLSSVDQGRFSRRKLVRDRPSKNGKVGMSWARQEAPC
jgi:hypothetical protein